VPPADVDRTGEVWTYRPKRHKTEHLDHDRVVDLGPRAQAALAPYLLGRAPDSFCFSPEEAMDEIRRDRHERRRTPLSQGNRPGSNRKTSPRRQPRDRYDVAAYRRAIARACERAGVARWSPHQLRHLAATELRQRYGIEAARVMLGHRDIGTALIYAEADRALSRRIAAEVG